MKAVVVYESHWGNTAAIARAIAQGIGPDVPALSTAEATGKAVADADLIIAGSPLIGFQLPTEKMLSDMATSPGTATRPDLSHPAMRSWLESLPDGHGRSAAFETRIWWSPGSAAKAIARLLAAKGYAAAAQPGRFIVKGKEGPLRDGELERARAWGAELASLDEG